MLGRVQRGDLAAPALYAAIAFLLFGLRLFRDGRDYVGTGVDPQIFIWSFGWWPHAVLHGENPFVTHAIWAPDGVNLAWTTTVPGLALLFAPLTLAAGAVTSYNVAAVLMPALAAWTAFLLCRHLTGRVWPSLAGGYLFGFSSYMLGQEQGHLHASSVFLVPLVALVVLRHVEGELSGRGLAVRLGPLLALQLLFGTEVFFTLALALACSLAAAFVLVPDRRWRLIDSLVPIAGSYALAAILTAPFVYYLLSGFQTRAFHPPQDYLTDVANFVVPTQLVLVAHGWAGAISSHFPGNDSERGAYLGVPAVVIVAWYAWNRLRTPGGRFLVVSLLLAVLASLGTTLTVDTHRVAPLPWEHIGYLPLFDNVLVERLSLYVVLATAVIVALWTARQRGVLQWALPALAILAVVPNPGSDGWAASYSVPRFFTDSAYRACLRADENILPLPASSTGNSDLWQVEGRFRFRMAGGYVFAGPPSSFLSPPAVEQVAQGNPVPAGGLRTVIRLKHVTSVVADPRRGEPWAGALARIATPHRIGGVILYRLAAPAPGCP